MDGIIVVNKPSGITSFDVIRKLRKILGIRKMGHSGTLDPMATGVLPIFIGKATKRASKYLEGDKGYAGEMVLGVETDTGDKDGKPSPLNPLSLWERGKEKKVLIDEKRVRAVFSCFTGEIEQIPPMYSAVKHKGKRLYELARKGIEVERKARKVKIYKLEPANEFSVPVIRFTVKCSKGTYIRQLVVDIGRELGTGAHLAKLERTYSHPFSIEQAHSLEEIESLFKSGQLDRIIIHEEN